MFHPTHLALIASAVEADQMPAFIGADPLPPDLLVADSTDKLPLCVFHHQSPELLQSQFVV